MPQIIQRSMTAGEISPSAAARSDVARYQSGLSLCKNFIIKAQGGAYSRPGTRFVGELDDSSKRGRLVAFSFNTEQTYILVFEHNLIRFIKDGGFILDDVGPNIYEVVTTYTEAELPYLQFTQSADVLTIVHPNHNPANLSRIADDDWSLDAIDYSPTVTAPTGVASAATGTGGGTYNKTYTYVVTAVDADGVESVASSSTSTTTNSLTTTYGIRVTWNTVTGADYYRIYKDPSNGTSVYGWIGDSNTLQFDDFNLEPITSDAPPEDRQPFSGADNKPSTVTYHQQRQIFANTTNEPQTIFTTQIGNFQSMRTSNPVRDDDAITVTIAAKQVNEIRHLVSLDQLMALTSGAVWKVTEGQDGVLTPSTIGVRVQSYHGASWVPPITVGSSILYIQEKGSKIRDLGYDFSSDSYTGNDLTVLADHLVEGYEIEEMAFAEEPYGILWCIRDDGALLGLTYLKEQKVWGWHQHDTQGEFESVAVISEDDRDAPYFIVKREIGGATVRYVERMEPRFVDAPENAFCIDSGLSYDGAATTTITGLDHLEGETVEVVADGNYVEDLVVNDGGIVLDVAASVVHVGLGYTPAIQDLDIDVPSPQQTLRGRKKAVSEVMIEVQDSRGGWIGQVNDLGEYNEDDMTEIKPRYDSDDYDPIALKSFKQWVKIPNSWRYGGRVRIEQRAPFPLAVLALIKDTELSE